VPSRVGVVLAAFGDEIVQRESPGDRVAGSGLIERLLVDDQLLLRLDQMQEVVDARKDLRAVGGLGDEVVRSGRARARFLVASSSSPEITITGIARMRGSSDFRMRSRSANPSSTGI